MDDQNNPNVVTPTPSYEPVQPGVASAIEPATTASVDVEPATQFAPTAPLAAPIEAPAFGPAVPPVPIAPASPTSPTGMASGSGPGSEPKRNVKGLLLGGIIAGAVVVLGGGSALAYNLYYQNAQKVVTDSIVNAMQAKTVTYASNLSIENEATKVKVVLDGASNKTAGKVNAKISAEIAGKTYSITAAGVLNDKNDAYFKVGDVAKIVDEFSEMIPVESQQVVDDIVAKIDNKWIKVTAEDTKSISEEASKAQTCMADALKKFQDDKAATKEIGTLYRKNQFIVISEKLGSKNGSLGYVLTGDSDLLKAFVLSLKDTAIYKQLHECDDSFNIDESDFKDLTDSKSDDGSVRVELWVDRWSHQMTKLSVEGKSTESSDASVLFTLEPKFNKDVTVETPSDATTFEQLSKDIEALSNDYQDSTTGSRTYSSDDTDSDLFDSYDY